MAAPYLPQRPKRKGPQRINLPEGFVVDDESSWLIRAGYGDVERCKIPPEVLAQAQRAVPRVRQTVRTAGGVSSVYGGGEG